MTLFVLTSIALISGMMMLGMLGYRIWEVGSGRAVVHHHRMPGRDVAVFLSYLFLALERWCVKKAYRSWYTLRTRVVPVVSDYTRRIAHKTYIALYDRLARRRTRQGTLPASAFWEHVARHKEQVRTEAQVNRRP